MVRPTDQEMVAIEKTIYYSQFPRQRRAYHAGPHQRTLRQWKAEGGES